MAGVSRLSHDQITRHPARRRSSRRQVNAGFGNGQPAHSIHVPGASRSPIAGISPGYASATGPVAPALAFRAHATPTGEPKAYRNQKEVAINAGNPVQIDLVGRDTAKSHSRSLKRVEGSLGVSGVVTVGLGDVLPAIQAEQADGEAP